MRVQVQKWGNSLAVRIPKPFARETRVGEGTALDLSVSKGKLVAAPIRRKRPVLKQMLAKVTKANMHAAVEWGAPVGREVW